MVAPGSVKCTVRTYSSPATPPTGPGGPGGPGGPPQTEAPGGSWLPGRSGWPGRASPTGSSGWPRVGHQGNRHGNRTQDDRRDGGATGDLVVRLLHWAVRLLVNAGRNLDS